MWVSTMVPTPRIRFLPEAATPHVVTTCSRLGMVSSTPFHFLLVLPAPGGDSRHSAAAAAGSRPTLLHVNV
jgi:hypothetical protein